MITKGQLEYMKEHPKEPMNMETFAECIAFWHERGEPTKADEPARIEIQEKHERMHQARLAYERQLYRRRKKKLDCDPYGG